MDKKFGVFVFLGLLIGATFGGLLGSTNGNPFAGLALGALAGVFLGWFIAAIEQQKTNKGNLMKTRLIFLTLLSFLLTACGMDTTLNTSTEKVFGAASTIADFDLLAGYSPEFSARLEVYTLVSYTPGDGHSHLYLIQSEKESDGEKLASMVEQIAPGSYDPQTRMTIIETRPIMVHDQETTLVISEGITSEGETYRQVAVAFQGKGGPALLILSQPIEQWNQDSVDAFIASIH